MVEILAEYDPESRGGNPADGRKVKGATIHWVDAATAVDAEVRLYDNLFYRPRPRRRGQGLPGLPEPQLPGGARPAARWRPPWPTPRPRDRFQFLRLGYFCVDSKDSKPGALVFNRAVSLKDSFKPGK